MCLFKPVHHGIFNSMKKQKPYNDLEQFLNNGIPSDSVYRALFETTENLTLIFDENTIIQKANSKFAELIGYTKEEVEGKKSWKDFIVKEDLDMLLKYNLIRSRTPQSAPKNYEFRVKNRNNEVILMYITIGIIPGTTYRIASLMDITERRQLEKEIIHINEDVQRKIGFDLHDDLAPHLLGIEALLNVVTKKLVKEKSATFIEVEKVRKLVVDAVQKTRGYAKVLCPVHLADYGLESAIMDLVRNTELMFNVNCTFTIAGESPDGNSDLSKNIFFIVKEAVHNAVKHAGAKNIGIFMEYFPDHSIVRVEDDGKGFDPSKKGSGIGLKIMKYRAEMMGAFFEISSQKNKGTTLYLEILETKINKKISKKKQ